MTRGNLWLQMLVFSLPLIFCNLLQVLFNMADLAVVGRFSGSLALGSVGSTSMIVNLFVGFLIGEAGGIGVFAVGKRHQMFFLRQIPGTGSQTACRPQWCLYL